MYWSLKTHVVFLFNNFSFRTTLVFIPIKERPGKKMGSLYSKRICKFGSILLGHFIKHKPLFLKSSPSTQIQSPLDTSRNTSIFFINGIIFPKQLMSNFSPKIHFSWFLNIKLCEKYICPINSLTNMVSQKSYF